MAKTEMLTFQVIAEEVGDGAHIQIKASDGRARDYRLEARAAESFADFYGAMHQDFGLRRPHRFHTAAEFGPTPPT